MILSYSFFLTMANIQSLRNFMGARDFKNSIAFYVQLGFTAIPLTPKMSLLTNDNIHFYLQDYYLKEWVENTMVVWIVDDIETYHTTVTGLDLPVKFPDSKVSAIKEEYWARILHIHDPAGNLIIVAELK